MAFILGQLIAYQVLGKTGWFNSIFEGSGVAG
jgi:hypothetical protein